MRKLKGQKDLVNYSAKIALEFGNVARAILYSQIIYRRDIKQRSNLYKTDRSWCDELWLWISEIRQAKKRLTEQWYIATSYKRLDHTTEYVVDWNLLNTLCIKLYWEPYRNSEHSQNLHSGMQNLTLGNENSDIGEWKNLHSGMQNLTLGNENSDIGEWKNLHSGMQNLTLDIKKEITTETTTESVEKVEPPSPTQFDKIEFVGKMRDAEKRWSVYLSHWNEITGRKDFLTEEIKKQLFNFSDLSLEEFKARAEKFEVIKSLILAKKMEKYFFSKIWERDFGQFLAKFNDFWGTDEEIVSKLAIFTEVKKALRILANPSEQTEAPPSPKKEQSEEEKKVSKEILETQRQKLLSKLSTQ